MRIPRIEDPVSECGLIPIDELFLAKVSKQLGKDCLATVALMEAHKFRDQVEFRYWFHMHMGVVMDDPTDPESFFVIGRFDELDEYDDDEDECDRVV